MDTIQKLLNELYGSDKVSLDLVLSAYDKKTWCNRVFRI